MRIREVAARELCVAIVLMFGLCSIMCVAPGASAEPVEVSTDLPPLALERLAAGVALGDDETIYVFGGYRYNYTVWDSPTNTVLIYNITSGVTTYGTSMSNGVAWPSCARLPDGRIAVMGGCDSSTSNGTKTVRIYDQRTDTWTANATAPVNISRASTVLGLDGKVYVFGPTDAQNSTLIYDPVGDAWSYGADFTGGRGRHSSSAVVYNETAIYVMGGFQYQLVWFPPPTSAWIPVFLFTDYVDVYDPVADSWTVGPDLTKDKMAGGAAMARDGCIHYYGGSGMGTPYDEVEVLDASSPGATWQLSSFTISKQKVHFGTVTDSYGRTFLVGGISGQPFTGIADVEMLLTAEVSEVNEIVVASPEDGASVNGTVEIILRAKNLLSAEVVMVDVYVDDDLLESQLGGGASEWVFSWDASGLALNSTHDVLAMAFFSDGSVSEDEVVYVVAEAALNDTIDERLSQIEEDIAALMDAVSLLTEGLADVEGAVGAIAADLAAISADIQDVQSTLLSVQTDLQLLQENMTALQTQLDSLATAIAELEMTTETDLSALSDDLAALSDMLDALTTTVDDMRVTLNDLAEQPQLSLDDVLDELDSLTDALEDLNQTVQGIDGTSGETEDDDDAAMYAMVAMVLAAVVLVALVASMIMSRRKA